MSTLRDGENSIQAPSLIDTGVTGFAFIDENFACRHHFHTYKLQVPQDLEVIDRRPIESGQITHITKISCQIGHHHKLL